MDSNALPEVHNSYKRLRVEVQGAWEAVTHERIKELIREMLNRCKAVIEAEEGHSQKDIQNTQKLNKSGIAKYL